MHKEDDDQSQIICQNVVAPLSGLEIATDTVTNATKTFNLATKNLSLVATCLGDYMYVPLTKKRLRVIKVSAKDQE